MEPKGKFPSAVPEMTSNGTVHETIVAIVEKPDCTIRVIENEDEWGDEEQAELVKETEVSLEKLDLGKGKAQESKDAEDLDFAKDRAKKQKKGAADADSDAKQVMEKDSKRRKMENSKDTETNGCKKSEDKAPNTVVYVTNFRVSREKLTSASPFFKTMLTSKYFKDTGKDVIELDCPASVLNVILCAAHGIYTELASDNVPSVSTTDLFERCVANAHTATAILDSMRLPAHELIAVVTKAEEYMIDFGLIGAWVRIWSASTADKTSFDVSMIAAAWHLFNNKNEDMADAFADWVADAIEKSEGPIEATAPSGYEDFEIPGEVLENMNDHREKFIKNVRLGINSVQCSDQSFDFWTIAMAEAFNTSSSKVELEIQSISQILQLVRLLEESAPIDSRGISRLQTWKPAHDLAKQIKAFQASRRCFCLFCIKRSLAEGHDRNSDLWRADIHKRWEDMCPRGHGFDTWKKSFAGSERDREELINARQSARWNAYNSVARLAPSYHNTWESHRRSSGRR